MEVDRAILVDQNPPTLAPTLLPGHDYMIPGLDDHDEDEGVLLSSTQEQILSILLVFSATLSILGSATIVANVIRNHKQASSYDRLLLGLSSCDILTSVIFGFSHMLMYRGSSSGLWAVGTEKTCAAIGIIRQLTYASMLYNAMLSYYYVMVTRNSLATSQIAFWEQRMHLLAIAFPLFTASFGAAFGIFPEAGCPCWTNKYPQAHAWGLAVEVLPFGFTALSLLINNFIIHRNIQTVLSESKPDFPAPEANRSYCLPSGGEHKVDTDERIERRKWIQGIDRQRYGYLGTFCFCYWSPLFLLVWEIAGNPYDPDVYALLVIKSVCMPLQGFLNMFVYHWPKYALLRREFPERSPTLVFCQACLSPSLPHSTLPVGQHPGLTSDRVTEENESEDRISPTQLACFFPPQPPQDYFTECAQRVLTESARSTLRTIAEDECDSGDAMEESKIETSLELTIDEIDGAEMGVIVLEGATIEVRGIDGTSGEEKQCDES